MKNLAIVAALLCLSLPALAQTAPPAADSAQKFAQHKAAILQKMQTHIASVQQKEQCVQAASDGQAIKACFPDRGEHGGHKSGCGGAPVK